MLNIAFVTVGATGAMYLKNYLSRIYTDANRAIKRKSLAKEIVYLKRFEYDDIGKYVYFKKINCYDVFDKEQVDKYDIFCKKWWDEYKKDFFSLVNDLDEDEYLSLDESTLYDLFCEMWEKQVIINLFRLILEEKEKEEKNQSTITDTVF